MFATYCILAKSGDYLKGFTELLIGEYDPSYIENEEILMLKQSIIALKDSTPTKLYEFLGETKESMKIGIQKLEQFGKSDKLKDFYTDEELTEFVSSIKVANAGFKQYPKLYELSYIIAVSPSYFKDAWKKVVDAEENVKINQICDLVKFDYDALSNSYNTFINFLKNYDKPINEAVEAFGIKKETFEEAITVIATTIQKNKISDEDISSILEECEKIYNEARTFIDEAIAPFIELLYNFLDFENYPIEERINVFIDFYESVFRSITTLIDDFIPIESITNAYNVLTTELRNITQGTRIYIATVIADRIGADVEEVKYAAKQLGKVLENKKSVIASLCEDPEFKEWYSTYILQPIQAFTDKNIEVKEFFKKLGVEVDAFFNLLKGNLSQVTIQQVLDALKLDEDQFNTKCEMLSEWWNSLIIAPYGETIVGMIDEAYQFVANTAYYLSSNAMLDAAYVASIGCSFLHDFLEYAAKDGNFGNNEYYVKTIEALENLASVLARSDLKFEDIIAVFATEEEANEFSTWLKTFLLKLKTMTFKQALAGIVFGPLDLYQTVNKLTQINVESSFQDFLNCFTERSTLVESTTDVTDMFNELLKIPEVISKLTEIAKSTNNVTLEEMLEMFPATVKATKIDLSFDVNKLFEKEINPDTATINVTTIAEEHHMGAIVKPLETIGVSACNSVAEDSLTASDINAAGNEAASQIEPKKKDDDDGLSGGVIAAIVIACVVVVAGIIAAVIIIRRKKQEDDITKV